MQFILLAGGVSSRLWPIPDKNTLKFCGQTLIFHQVQKLWSLGFERGVVICNPQNQAAIQESLKEFQAKLTFVTQAKPSGICDAVLLAEGSLKKGLGTMLLSTNDLLEKSGLEQLVAAGQDKNLLACVLAKEMEEYFPGGYIKLDDKDFMTELVEKPAPDKRPSKLVNIVAHFYPDWEKVFSLLHETKVKGSRDPYEIALNNAAQSGAKIKVCRYQGFWQALKYPWHVLSMLQYFLKELPNKIDSSAQIAANATVVGPVVIEAGVRILEHATVRGPVYLGAGVIVANNALVRESQVGAGSVVGYNTEVARSYLGENVWTHSNYVGDSVICDNCSFGAGTVTGNLRLDEGEISSIIKGEKVGSGLHKLGVVMGPGVRVGVNTNFMPGVKVGAGAFIGAGLNVAEDVSDETFLALKQEYLTKKNVVKTLGDRTAFKKKL